MFSLFSETSEPTLFLFYGLSALKFETYRAPTAYQLSNNLELLRVRIILASYFLWFLQTSNIIVSNP